MPPPIGCRFTYHDTSDERGAIRKTKRRWTPKRAAPPAHTNTPFYSSSDTDRAEGLESLIHPAHDEISLMQPETVAPSPSLSASFISTLSHVMVRYQRLCADQGSGLYEGS